MCGVRTGDCSNPESNKEKVYVSGAQAGKCLMCRIEVQIPGTHIKIQVWLQALREWEQVNLWVHRSGRINELQIQ